MLAPSRQSILQMLIKANGAVEKRWEWRKTKRKNWLFLFSKCGTWEILRVEEIKSIVIIVTNHISLFITTNKFIPIVFYEASISPSTVWLGPPILQHLRHSLNPNHQHYEYDHQLHYFANNETSPLPVHHTCSLIVIFVTTWLTVFVFLSDLGFFLLFYCCSLISETW